MLEQTLQHGDLFIINRAHFTALDISSYSLPELRV
jgi:hypothetical protein